MKNSAGCEGGAPVKRGFATPVLIDAFLWAVVMTMGVDAWQFHIVHRGTMRFSGCGNGMSHPLWLPDPGPGLIFSFVGMWVMLPVMLYLRHRGWGVWVEFLAGPPLFWIMHDLAYPF